MRIMIGVIQRHEEEEEGLMELINRAAGMEVKRRKRESSERRMVMNFAISELTRGGQMVIRRFIPSHERQRLNYPWYLSLDSDDRVFVADHRKNTVILLDCDLKWNRVLCTTREGKEGTWVPFRLCYDEEMKILIVGGAVAGEVNVYTLNRN